MDRVSNFCFNVDIVNFRFCVACLCSIKIIYKYIGYAKNVCLKFLSASFADFLKK